MTVALACLVALTWDVGRGTWDEVADAIKKLRAAADLSARYQAEYDLGRVLTPKHIPIVLREVDLGPVEVRPHFIRAIRSVGGKEATAALKGLLAKYEMKSRVEAAYALKILGEDDGMKAIVVELGKPGLTKDDKLAIVQYLYVFYYDGKEVPPALRKVIAEESDPIVRRSALNSLVSHKDPESAPFLWKIADAATDSLATEALAALIKMGDAKAVERGLEMLEKGKVPLTSLYEILFALRLAGGRDIAARLRALLEKATDVNTQMQLISTLSQLKDVKSIPLLVRLAEDKNPSVAEAALQALVELAGRGQIELFRRLLKHEEASRRLKAAEALLGLDDISGIPILRDALNDKTQYTRQRAATALANFRVPEVEQPLFVAMTDEDVNIRTTASNGLLATFTHLFPYRRFDLKAVGYDAKSTDPDARKAAIEKLQAWWEKNR
jgi:HEAT repeat protein